MVWGCISYKGVGELRVIDDTMDSIAYTRVLSECLHDSVSAAGLSGDFMFQQDNAPCHKSTYTKEFFRVNDINVIDWPAQSPDLNPIENVWAFIKQKLKNYEIKSRSFLIEKVTEIWGSISPNYIKRLYDGMPKRLEMVIRNGGGHIPY